jgi:DNA-binding MarR family transcriptional regulator
MNEQAYDTIEVELAILIRHITSISSDKKFGNLDRSAYLLLHQISTHGSAGVKALAEIFQLDMSTVSRQAAALEQKGYVCRIPNPLDKRAFPFHITDLGMKELLQYKQARSAKLMELLDDWSDEECQNFGQLLKKFNRIFI